MQSSIHKYSFYHISESVANICCRVLFSLHCRALDNFSKEMADIPKGLHDCYFFYYSTCSKVSVCVRACGCAYMLACTEWWFVDSVSHRCECGPGLAEGHNMPGSSNIYSITCVCMRVDFSKRNCAPYADNTSTNVCTRVP